MIHIWLDKKITGSSEQFVISVIKLLFFCNGSRNGLVKYRIASHI